MGSAGVPTEKNTKFYSELGMISVDTGKKKKKPRKH